MKKFLVLFLIFPVLLLSSCRGLFMVNSIDTDPEKMVEKIIDSIEKSDQDAFKKLFAKNALKEIDDFETKAQELFSYYDGEYLEYEDMGTMDDISRIDGYVEIFYHSSCDITTTKGVFRIATKAVTKDSKDKDNVGLWSIYILEKEKDWRPENSYRGDLLYNTGIFVDFPRP